MKKIKSKKKRFFISLFVAFLFKIIELIIIYACAGRAVRLPAASNALFFCVELIAARIIVDWFFEPKDEPACEK